MPPLTHAPTLHPRCVQAFLEAAPPHITYLFASWAYVPDEACAEMEAVQEAFDRALGAMQLPQAMREAR